jgi:hypothetical protein
MNYGPAIQPPQFDHRQTGYYWPEQNIGY